ncbi:MAG: hypothetical protein ACPGLY_10560 [Rubripirellula sp.]
MNADRSKATKKFEASPIHRKITVQFVSIVLAVAATCVVLINTLPTSHLNNLVPLTIATGLSILFYLAIKYQRAVSKLIDEIGLRCDHCGKSTIARPDHIQCRSVPTMNESTCDSCQQKL